MCVFFSPSFNPSFSMFTIFMLMFLFCFPPFRRPLRLLWTEKPQWCWKVWYFYQVGNSCLSKLPACWIVEFDIVKPWFFRWVDWEGSLTPTSKMGFYTKALASAFVSPRGCEGIVPGFNRWWLRLGSVETIDLCCGTYALGGCQNTGN